MPQSLLPVGAGEFCFFQSRLLADWRCVCSGVTGNWCAVGSNASSSRRVVEENGKSGIPDQDSSSNTDPFKRRAARKVTGGLQKQQNHSDGRMTMLGGMGMINGLVKAGAKAGTIGRMRLGATPSQRTIPRLCQRGMETQNSLMTMSLMFLMYKSVSNPGDHCILVPRLISGLTGRAREHLGDGW